MHNTSDLQQPIVVVIFHYNRFDQKNLHLCFESAEGSVGDVLLSPWTSKDTLSCEVPWQMFL
jgi:hypothetical protein